MFPNVDDLRLESEAKGACNKERQQHDAKWCDHPLFVRRRSAVVAGRLPRYEGFDIAGSDVVFVLCRKYWRRNQIERSFVRRRRRTAERGGSDRHRRKDWTGGRDR